MNVRYLLEITVQGGKWLHGILKEKETWVGKHCRGALQKLKEDKVVSERSIIGKLATLQGKLRDPLSYRVCRLIMLVWNKILNCAVYSGFLN